MIVVGRKPLHQALCRGELGANQVVEEADRVQGYALALELVGILDKLRVLLAAVGHAVAHKDDCLGALRTLEHLGRLLQRILDVCGANGLLRGKDAAKPHIVIRVGRELFDRLVGKRDNAHGELVDLGDARELLHGIRDRLVGIALHRTRGIEREHHLGIRVDLLRLLIVDGLAKRGVHIHASIESLDVREDLAWLGVGQVQHVRKKDNRLMHGNVVTRPGKILDLHVVDNPRAEVGTLERKRDKTRGTRRTHAHLDRFRCLDAAVGGLEAHSVETIGPTGDRMDGEVGIATHDIACRGPVRRDALLVENLVHNGLLASGYAPVLLHRRCRVTEGLTPLLKIAVPCHVQYRAIEELGNLVGVPEVSRIAARRPLLPDEVGGM